ncbi:hypothetical protein CBR_g17683 [Chara braunii]|uniref:Smr domain-containing protein n=1 Tax=Chara braunii TaxID=69332 RepID=A0A388KV99_CHABU|nr:hypothetical protein CBR_g17683 [Chara braunii]|eukprot:GBG73971.1 hypothetical protein CBR_g17683 [Chara braunii]
MGEVDMITEEEWERSRRRSKGPLDGDYPERQSSSSSEDGYFCTSRRLPSLSDGMIVLDDDDDDEDAGGYADVVDQELSDPRVESRRCKRRAAEQFVLDMLGDGADVNLGVVRDVLDHFEGDTQKSVETLINILSGGDGVELERGDMGGGGQVVVPPLDEPMSSQASLWGLLIGGEEDLGQQSGVGGGNEAVAERGGVGGASTSGREDEEEEEEGEGEEEKEDGLWSEDALITLMTAFPQFDYGSIEDVLNRHRGDLEAAGVELLEAGDVPHLPPHSKQFDGGGRGVGGRSEVGEREGKEGNSVAVALRRGGSGHSQEVRQAASASDTHRLRLQQSVLCIEGGRSGSEAAGGGGHRAPAADAGGVSTHLSTTASAPPLLRESQDRLGLLCQVGYSPSLGEQQSSVTSNELYRQQRAKSREYFSAMKARGQEAAAAFARGDYKTAQGFAEEAAMFKKLALQESNTASAKIFMVKNKAIRNTISIDLHQQHVDEALRYLELHLQLLSAIPSVEYLLLITGKGKHSQRKVAKIKPAVIEYLRKQGIPWSEQNGGGCLRIKIDGVCPIISKRAMPVK